MKRRLGLCVAVLAALTPLLAAAPPARLETYAGKVVPLTDLLDKIGSKLDADAKPHWLALVTDDGTVLPLIKDGGGRRFFKDDRLLKRPMRVTGRLLPGSTLLQVVDVHSVVGGKVCEVYYWCDICSIRRSEKMICECCGGAMDLKEEPVPK